MERTLESQRLWLGLFDRRLFHSEQRENEVKSVWKVELDLKVNLDLKLELELDLKLELELDLKLESEHSVK